MSLVLFVVIAALMSIDLTIEFRRGEPIALQTFELLIFTSALAGIAFHWWQMRSERRRSIALGHELAAARDEARKWSEDAEVALLQLKGLRHRDIAELRCTSERTVRQQALAVYRKSGLNGRSDLAAFFLEDLLLPVSSTSLAG